MAAHQDAIFLNSKLFRRVETIYNQRESLKLDPEKSSRLVNYYHQAFVHAGAKLSDAEKTKLEKLNERRVDAYDRLHYQTVGRDQGSGLSND